MTVYSLWRVQFDGRPISVLVRQEQRVWVAENSSLNICGFGDSPSAAINEAEQHIRHFVAYYAAIPLDKLTGQAIQLKQKFSQLTVIPNYQ